MTKNGSQGQGAGRAGIETCVRALGLQDVAANAFATLCERGCKPETLTSFFQLWAEPDVPIVSTTGREIHLRPMDNRKAALGTFQKKDLDRLQRRLRKQAKTLERLAKKLHDLQATRLFRRMLREGEFDVAREFLDLARRLNGYAATVIPRMVKVCGSIGSKKHPDRNRERLTLAGYVLDATGRRHYKELSQILNHVRPTDTGDAGALKQAIYRARAKARK
jgi:hypothetical protein